MRPMFVEMHLLQNFALSNLNRDDTGAPKSCVFGGTRRARISSQCLKRAVRTYVREQALVPSELLSYRTKWLQRELANRLAAGGVEAEQAGQVAARALELLEFRLKNGRTEYLLMVGEREIARIADLCREHAAALQGGDGGRKSKKEGDNLAGLFLKALDGGDAVDIALFGRMIATHPEKNVDAAVQMAHAFSTNAIANEFDFYSAVDDLQQQDDDEGAGAGMLGTVLYNSSCYYRYANVDLRQLLTNLGGDPDRALTAVRAFLLGMVHAVPTGKRTNSAPQNPPALIMAVVREHGLWSLANAFVVPVSGARGNLMELSAKEMLAHWNQLSELYGQEGVQYAGLATYLSSDAIGASNAVGIAVEKRLADLVDRVLAEVQPALA
ncbi:MAG: type I-E CRISPR-associated protein Cas7/Cse4/CasC [Symbiobacterium thermophilum]|uniref:Type I-E CRISPR-associated protein Cas7/Cse4/CasC n=2 Tax=Symbiobacterium thermophilum TaxID=2734 RepID=A0A953LH68_SYMTR|nr:type I-E CRISPR-associated protein Cas7/Cse4/CasC [Symbiobacterium thermophilum]